MNWEPPLEAVPDSGLWWLRDAEGMVVIRVFPQVKDGQEVRGSVRERAEVIAEILNRYAADSKE